MRLWARLFVAALLFLPAPALAFQFSANGYDGRVSPVLSHEYLSFDGRLNSGPSCSSVRLVARLENGRRDVTLQAFVPNWQGGSRLIQSSTFYVGNVADDWRVVLVQVDCVQR